MSGYRGSVKSGHSGPVSTEDQRNQRNSGNRGPVEQLVQRTSEYKGPVGTKDQRNSG